MDARLRWAGVHNYELKFDKHINQTASRAQQVANLIHKCFVSKDTNMLVQAYTTYIRPLLVYALSVQGRRNEYESGGARIHPARSAGKIFLSCPPLFIQCPLSGGAQCNVLSLQPSTVHRPRGYKVCKLSHC